MPRTFSVGFASQKDDVKNAEPFLTAIIRFGDAHGGDLALVGRGIDILATVANVKQPTIAGSIHYAIVNDWGTLGSGFGSQADGTPDLIETTLRCNNYPVIDVGYRLSDRFIAEIETVPIDIYWNFIVGSTVYQAEGPSGSVHAPTSFGLREVSLRVTSLMDTYLQRSVLHVIQGNALPNAPQSSRGKAFPLAIGDMAESTAVDGARVPAIVVDTHQPTAPITAGVNTFALVACEAPLSGLVVSSLGARYYQGHKIVEQDLVIDTSGTSADFPLFGTAPTQGSGQDGIAEGFGVFDDPFFDLNDDPYVEIGHNTTTPAISPLGHLGYQILAHPFRYDYPTKLTAMAVTATATDTMALTTPGGDGTYRVVVDDFTSSWVGLVGPLRPLALKIVDESTYTQGDPVSPLDNGTPEAIGAQRRSTAYNVTPQAYQQGSVFPATGSAVFTGAAQQMLNADAHFDLHGWAPQVGKNYKALLYVGNAGSSGVPDDPGNQWYNIKTDPFPPSPGSYFGQPSFEGTDTLHGLERVFSPSFPGFTQQISTQVLDTGALMRFYAINDGQDGQTGQPEDGADVGTSGIFQMAFEPDDARVIAAITVYVKQRLPSGSATPIELSGSLTVTVNELDRNDQVIATLGSASFAAEDYTAILNSTVYQPVTQFLSGRILILSGHKYGLSINGQIDANGKFSGWAVQGITNPTFTTGYLPPGGRVGNVTVFGGSYSPKPILTDASEPVSIRIKLHVLKFDTSIETWDGVRAWTLRPYCLDTDKRFTLDDGEDIATDPTCPVMQPNAVIRALLNRAGVDDARIDIAGTFTDSGVFYAAANWKLRGAVCEQITYKALIARLAFESRSDFDWEFHQAQLKWLPQPGDTVTSARTLTFPDMPQVSDQDPLPDFHVTRTETDSIYNVINVAFQRMFRVSKGTEAYLLGDQFISLPSMAVHGPKTNDPLFQMDFIRDAALAVDLGQFYLLWLAYAREKPLFTTFLHTLELMKGDVLTLDCTIATTTEIFNGWLAQPVLIRAIQHDIHTRRIQYTGVVL